MARPKTFVAAIRSRSAARTADVGRQLRAYFGGTLRAFAVPVDSRASRASSVACSTPPRSSRRSGLVSYGDIARRIGRPGGSRRRARRWAATRCRSSSRATASSPQGDGWAATPVASPSSARCCGSRGRWRRDETQAPGYVSGPRMERSVEGREARPVETPVAREEGIGLKQRVDAHQEVGHDTRRSDALRRRCSCQRRPASAAVSAPMASKRIPRTARRPGPIVVGEVCAHLGPNHVGGEQRARSVRRRSASRDRSPKVRSAPSTSSSTEVSTAVLTSAPASLAGGATFGRGPRIASTSSSTGRSASTARTRDRPHRSPPPLRSTASPSRTRNSISVPVARPSDRAPRPER